MSPSCLYRQEVEEVASGIAPLSPYPSTLPERDLITPVLF
jgi:hypothetical protein